MSLSPRRIATLGVGFGALSVAYLGLWPVASEQPPSGLPTVPIHAQRGSWVLAHEPVPRVVSLLLVAREELDAALVRIDAVDPFALTLNARESVDSVALGINATSATLRVALKDAQDRGTLALSADWAADDAEIEAILPTLLQ